MIYITIRPLFPSIPFIISYREARTRETQNDTHSGEGVAVADQSGVNRTKGESELLVSFKSLNRDSLQLYPC